MVIRIASMYTILDHIPIGMKRQGSTNGGEWGGPCPRCGGRDRFRAWPKTGRFWCRQCEWAGDTIDLLRELKGMSFQEAKSAVYPGHELYMPPRSEATTINTVKLLKAPNSTWCNRAWEVAKECVDRLWSPEGSGVLDWLRSRGLSDEIIESASLGYSSEEREDDSSAWGIDREKHIFIDKGVVIPWFIGGEIWRLNIRRNGKPKYRGPAGYSNGLYLADGIRPRCTVVLTEGEFDALSIVQAVQRFVAVATGTTSGSRKPKWIARLAQAEKVLVAFDSDDAGEKAAQYWLTVLPNAKRVKPTSHDANQMLQNGEDLNAWLMAEIQYA